MNIIKSGMVFIAMLAITGCGTLAEISDSRDSAREYLLGSFDRQIIELESLAAECPSCGYNTTRIVQEVIPLKVSGPAIALRTKYEAPNAKIRLYGRKVNIPTTPEEVDKWIATIDENIGKLKAKLILEKDQTAKNKSNTEVTAKNEFGPIGTNETVSKKLPDSSVVNTSISREDAIRKIQQVIINKVSPLLTKKQVELLNRVVEQNIQKEVTEDGKVRLYSYDGYERGPQTNGDRVLVSVTELLPGDIGIIPGGAYFGCLRTTSQWENRCRASYNAQKEAERKRAEEVRKAAELKAAEERKAAREAERKRAEETERIARENKIKDVRNACIKKLLALAQQDIAVINNENLNLYKSLYAISTNDLLRTITIKRGGKTIAGKAIDMIGQYQDSEYANLTNMIYVGRPNKENPWNIEISITNMAEMVEELIIKDIPSHMSADDIDKSYSEDLIAELTKIETKSQKGERKEYYDFIAEAKKALDCIKEEIAVEKKRRQAAAVASKLIAEMSESEKFPLLSVQPKPQMLMKDVPSGASVKWIEGWLTANKVVFEELQKETIHDEWYYKLTGTAPQYTGKDVIKATIKGRKVGFRFKDGVLVGVNIKIRGAVPTVNQLIEKYLCELGGSAKVERGNKGKGEYFPGDTSTPEGHDYFRQVMWFAQDCFANVANSDVNVRIDYKAFAGLVAVSQDTLAMMNLLGVEEQLRYHEFSKEGKADLIIRADGSVLRCTSAGETLKSWFAQLPALEKCKSVVERKSDKVIMIEDRKLKAHFDAIEQRKADAARKAAEEAKKKADAEALNF